MWRLLLLPLVVACETGAVQAPSAFVNANPLDADDLQIVVGPSNDGAALIASINDARSSVHMLMYLLTDVDVIDAVLAKHAEGLDVRVVLNADVPNGVSNAKSFKCLQSRGVPVRWAPRRFEYSHSKLVALDAKAAWIMTMNAAHSSLLNNREFLALTTNKALVDETERLFEADYEDSELTATPTSLVISPLNAREKIGALVQNAIERIDIMAAALTDYRFVGDLCAAAERGVAVRAMTDGTTTAQQLKVVQKLVACGAHVFVLEAPLIHAKALVADGRRAYVGSVNFTANSIQYNRELGLITEQPSAVGIIAATIDADIAAGTELAMPVACQNANECSDACINGFCQSYCLEGGQCAPGKVCTLENTCIAQAECGECPQGLVCKGVCSHCANDSECGDGNVCRRGFCKAAPVECSCFGNRPVCNAEKKCVPCDQGECPMGTVCDTDACSVDYGRCR